MKWFVISIYEQTKNRNTESTLVPSVRPCEKNNKSVSPLRKCCWTSGTALSFEKQLGNLDIVGTEQHSNDQSKFTGSNCKQPHLL